MKTKILVALTAALMTVSLCGCVQQDNHLTDLINDHREHPDAVDVYNEEEGHWEAVWDEQRAEYLDRTDETLEALLEDGNRLTKEGDSWIVVPVE